MIFIIVIWISVVITLISQPINREMNHSNVSNSTKTLEVLGLWFRLTGLFHREGKQVVGMVQAVPGLRAHLGDFVDFLKLVKVCTTYFGYLNIRLWITVISTALY